MKKILVTMLAAACTLGASAQKQIAEDADYIRPSMYSIKLDIAPKSHAEAHKQISAAYDNLPINPQYNDVNLKTRHIDAAKLPTATKEEIEVYGKESALASMGKEAAANAAEGTGANVNTGPSDYEYIARLMKWFEADKTAHQLVANWFNPVGAPTNALKWDQNEEKISLCGLKGISADEKKNIIAAGRNVAIKTTAYDELLNTTYVTVTRYNYFTAEELIELAMATAKATLDKAIGKGGPLAALAQKGYDKAVEAAKKKYAGNYVKAITYLFKIQTPGYNALAEKYYENGADFMNDADIKMVYVGKSVSGYKGAGKSEGDTAPIARATKNAVNGTYASLQMDFEQFCPMSALHEIDGNLGVYIGTAEGVTEKSKFNVYEKELDVKSGKLAYNKVGSLKVQKGAVWVNAEDDDPDAEKVAADSSRTYTQLAGKPSKKAGEGMLVKIGK